jgi:hypothetical protein
MSAGTDQPIVEGAGRFQVGGGEGDMVDPQDVRRGQPPAMARRVRSVSTERQADRQAIGSFETAPRRQAKNALHYHI